MMQVGTLIEFKSLSLAPMIGSSAPLANCARQRSMAAMDVFGSIAISSARFSGPRGGGPLKMRGHEGGAAAPGLRRGDVWDVVLLGDPRRGNGPAGDAPQQQRAHGMRIFQREQHGEPAAGGAAAEDRRQRI